MRQTALTALWTERPVLAEFSPGEAAQITGLSTDLQRVWRRRAQLPPAGSRAKFGVLDVAALSVRNALSLRGFSPNESGDIGARCAPIVLYHALMEADSTCVVFGPEAAVDRFEAAYFNDDKLIAQLAEVEDVARFLMVVSDLAPTLVNDLTDYHDRVGGQSGFYVSLEDTGRMLGERAIKPLITVKLGSPQEGESRVIRRVMKHGKFVQRRKRRSQSVRE